MVYIAESLKGHKVTARYNADKKVVELFSQKRKKAKARRLRFTTVEAKDLHRALGIAIEDAERVVVMPSAGGELGAGE